jgi:hypothetical protein
MAGYPKTTVASRVTGEVGNGVAMGLDRVNGNKYTTSAAKPNRAFSLRECSDLTHEISRVSARQLGFPGELRFMLDTDLEFDVW